MFDAADELTTTPARETALACLREGIAAAKPNRVVADAVSVDGDVLRVADAEYDLAEYDDVVVVGGGKAADGVADALETVLGDRISDGVVVTTDPADGDGIERLQGDHPVPSAEGVQSTAHVRELVERADERTLVLAVITGGASAILPAPVESVGLGDLQETTDALLSAGADIDDLNAVRKHLSTLKGGSLARVAAPATVVSLVFSDVVGNDLSVIASGPTAPDESTYADAVDVLDRYGVDAPASVADHLRRGVAGEIPETPRADDPVFERVHTHVLADGFTALSAAAETARERGYEPCVLSSRIRGEASESARTHAGIAAEVDATGNPVDSPAVVLSGGETTVTVIGDGEGGPNLEFALAAALDLRGMEAFALGSVDTDGRDGGTDVAGAVVDEETVTDATAARAALSDNDALGFLRSRNAVLRTGNTGTNVNDLRVMVVE